MANTIESKDMYKFIDAFETQEEWKEFARSRLLLTNVQVNDIIADHKAHREQKYQMLSLWMRKNGRAATLGKLDELKGLFFNSDTEANVDNNDQIGSSSSSNIDYQPQPLESDIHREEPRATQNRGAAARTFGGLPSRTPDNDGYKRGPQIEIQQNDATDASSLCDVFQQMKISRCSVQDIRRHTADSHRYEIKHNPKGYVLIINNYFHEEEKVGRIGSEVDVENMTKLWKALDCQVTVKLDLKAHEMEKTLNTVANHPQIGNFDYISVFIMSHGKKVYDTEVIVGSDKQAVKVDSILSIFDNTNCKALIGKPKLFFFQFCRGEDVDTGVRQCSDGRDEMDELFSSLKLHWKDVDIDAFADGQESGQHPVRSDLLISYATQSGYKSFRNKKGSWFINAIANIFMEHAKDEHVADMMTKVRLAVSQKNGKTRQGGESVHCKEMSETRTLLRKKLYLMPGYKPGGLDI